MGGALEGIRVLELARYQAGPRGGMILSDLGAEVIKIEKLGGEETRRSEPLVRGKSVYFSVYNRGKKSLCLDLRTPRGKEIFAALVPTADVVLENFRPGTMAKMGFGYDQLRALKPDIILTSVSGFGQYGPYRERPAFDPLGQAMSGLMSLTGAPVGTPHGGRGVVRRKHRGPYRQGPARRRDSGRAGQDDSAGRRGSASLGTRDAGQDAGPGRRRNVPPRCHDQDVEDARPRRPGPDPGPAHRRGPLRDIGLRPRDLGGAAPSEGDRLTRNHCRTARDAFHAEACAHFRGSIL